MQFCPRCNCRSEILETRRCSNDSIRRRHRCLSCEHRWTTHQGKPPGHRGGLRPGQRVSQRRITEAEVRAILTATGSASEIAQKLGRSHPTVLSVLTGRRYADLAPELPRRIRHSNRTCLSCRHWAGCRCRLGFPDPIDEGPSFGAECASYLA